MESAKKYKSVLIVDSDNELALAVASSLTEAGFETSHVTNTREAGFRLQSAKFSCILLDLCLGKENGEHVIHIARNPKGSENSRTPILMMTGTLDKEKLVRIAPYVKGVLIKPFGMEALVDQIVKICGAA